jgi:hypothetical protein
LIRVDPQDLDQALQLWNNTYAKIELFFKDPKEPDCIDQPSSGEHGRIEVRKIRVPTELNDYLNFPHVGQAFAIERQATNKKTGKQ